MTTIDATAQPDKFRWTVAETEAGFTVSAPERNTVTVELEKGKYFVVRGLVEHRVQLYKFSALVEKIVECSLLGVGRYHHRNIERWARDKAARIISKEVKEQWQRLLSKVDPKVRQVQKAVFAATFAATPLIGNDALYADSHLISDLCVYPAAGKFLVALGKYKEDVKRKTWHNTDGGRALVNALGLNGISGGKAALILNQAYAAIDGTEIGEDEQIALARDWRQHLSITGKSYKSLNITLDNLPGGIPAELLYYLSHTHLQRPITNRLELLALLLYIESAEHGIDIGWRRRNDRINESIFMFAQREQIIEAMRRVARFTHNTWKHTKAGDVRQFVHFLTDYNSEHTGNIVGLADKAIEWHRYDQERIIQEKVSKHGAAAPTTAPPIALPDDDGIVFLATVGAVAREAATMEHCVASYIDSAVYGHCFLFHIDYNGEMATAEVSSYNRTVAQSQGPHNRRNAASEYGRRLLSKWAKRLPVATIAANPFADELQPF